MKFPVQFISASSDYADFDHQVPAPYIRKKFVLPSEAQSACLLITGLGFYRVFLNGTEITKSILAPYISNPDDLIYFDSYQVASFLRKGENVIGILLGNGMQNPYGGFIWDFDRVRWRSAPMTALRLEAGLSDGTDFYLESDASFKTYPSGLLENEFRSGETYDARLEIDGWDIPGYDDSAWKTVIQVTPPRGKMKLCKASPIREYEVRKAISIIPYEEGYLYDFGVDTAGVCELNISGSRGQKVEISYQEWYHDGILDKRNIMFPDADSPYLSRVQDFCYICRGDGKEGYTPWFSFYGFRYAYVRGITKEQATEELLICHCMSGAFQENGSFSCSDETAVLLQTMTRRATLSNFFWFPTDCPHREKNGWTGDAALSAEHMLMNLKVDDSLREWLHNVEAAQDPGGELPGIVPTGGWGFGNGPAWDQVIVEIPFCLYRLRGDLDTAKEAAPFIFRYLFFLAGSRNEKGLIDSGLGDWCEPGKSGGGQKAPVEVTSTAVGVHLLEEAKILFRALDMPLEYRYADSLREELRQAFRKYLICFPGMTVAGSCQASQAMAIHYGLFEKAECREAFQRLLEMIHERDDHIDAGALGLRVLFHVLSDFGESDLAYHMITRKDYPSYGHWIERGGTSLWEDFLPASMDAHSRNHHFFGDISSWFIQKIAGIVPNPFAEDVKQIYLKPHFIRTLSWAEGKYGSPTGEISVRWERISEDGDCGKSITGKERIKLCVKISGEVEGKMILPDGWRFEDGFGEKQLKEGVHVCERQQKLMAAI